MKKVISFCLWEQPNGVQDGRDSLPSYILGAILNADIAKEEWQDWTCRYYIDKSTIDESIINELKSRDNVEVFLFEKNEGYFSTLWRFYAFTDDNLDYVISRDVDSRLHVRDKASVDEWISSGKDYHIIRDHCQHTRVMAAGMWGAKSGLITEQSLDSYRDFCILKNTKDKFGNDQDFLEHVIYPHAKTRAIIHDDWTTNQPIFVGEERISPPIPRIRGEGWWNQELPEWHSADKKQTCVSEECNLDCPDSWCTKTPCPCCKKYHDNDYIGKKMSIDKKEYDKYSHLIGVKV